MRHIPFLIWDRIFESHDCNTQRHFNEHLSVYDVTYTDALQGMA
jgi:hypothetical protein